MKHQNINIIGHSIYHPKKRVENDFFIDHFEKMDLGKQAQEIMETLGRKSRYLIDNEEENSITMAVEASKNALKDSNITANMLDAIVFVSETPEHTIPANALIINNLLGAKNAHMIYDLNINCIGLLSAIDQVGRHFITNPHMKYALIVGSLNISAIAKDTDLVVYPNIADGSGAIILAREEEDYKRGLIDSIYYTNSDFNWTMRFPQCGLSKVFDGEINMADKKYLWNPHHVDFFSDDWKRMIETIVERNNLNIEDIDHYFFSQFSRPDAELTLNKLNVSLDKSTFVGHKYGYTGNTSPLFAMDEALKKKRIAAGSKVIFISVAGGYSMCALLYEF